MLPLPSSLQRQFLIQIKIFNLKIEEQHLIFYLGSQQSNSMNIEFQ